MTAPELKPCPFCNGSMENRGYGAIHIDAGTCPLGGLAIDPEKWNRRADLAAVQPAQVRVKPLVWQHEARNGWKVGVAWTTGYHIIRRDDGWHYGSGDGGVFQSIEAAKAAAQADYEARICAALEPQPDPRDEVIARLVEALTNMLEIRAVWTDPHNDTDCKHARAARAAIKAVQHG